MSTTTLSSCARSTSYALVTTAGAGSATTPRNIFTGATLSVRTFGQDILWNTGTPSFNFTHIGTKQFEVIMCISLNSSQNITGTFSILKNGVAIPNGTIDQFFGVSSSLSTFLTAIVSVTSDDVISAQLNASTTTFIAQGSSLMVKCISGVQSGPTAILQSTLLRSGKITAAKSLSATLISTTSLVWTNLLESTASPYALTWGASVYTPVAGVYTLPKNGYYHIIINAVMVIQTISSSTFTITPVLNGVASTPMVVNSPINALGFSSLLTYNIVTYFTAAQTISVNVISSFANQYKLGIGSSIYIRLISAE